MKHIFTVGIAIALIAAGWGFGKHLVAQYAPAMGGATTTPPATAT